MSLAADEHASSQVRAVALLKLDELKKWLGSQENLLKDVPTRAEFFYARNQIDHFEKNPVEVHVTAPATPPPAIHWVRGLGVIGLEIEFYRNFPMFFISCRDRTNRGIYFEGAGKLKDIVETDILFPALHFAHEITVHLDHLAKLFLGQLSFRAYSTQACAER